METALPDSQVFNYFNGTSITCLDCQVHEKWGLRFYRKQGFQTAVGNRTTFFYGPSSSVMVPTHDECSTCAEPNQSITVLWQERNNQLNLNKLKFQHKEMFCLNLYVLLQKCTRLTFILQIGLDMQALDQVRLFPLTSLGMLLGKKRYGSAVRKRRQDATRKPSHQAPTQRRSLGSNSISSGERKESQTELLSVIQPKKNKEEWKRHELFKI